jgi:hypothetical protein
MNCPLATSRFFIRTLHQVHRRSGTSAEEDTLETAMKNILTEHQEPCQPAAR